VRRLFLFFLLCTTGCYRATFVNDAVVPSLHEVSESHTQAYLFWGVLGDGEVDVRWTCTYDAYRITWAAHGFDIALTVATLGLLATRSVTIECGVPRR